MDRHTLPSPAPITPLDGKLTRLSFVSGTCSAALLLQISRVHCPHLAPLLLALLFLFVPLAEDVMLAIQLCLRFSLVFYPKAIPVCERQTGGVRPHEAGPMDVKVAPFD